MKRITFNVSPLALKNWGFSVKFMTSCPLFELVSRVTAYNVTTCISFWEQGRSHLAVTCFLRV